MLELCRLLGGFVISLSLIPQIYHTHKSKKVDDISYMWQGCYITGISLSLAYEFYYNLWMMYIPTSFEAFCIIVLTCMKYRYSKIVPEKSPGIQTQAQTQIEIANQV